MQIKISGFELHLGNGIGLKSFTNHILSRTNIPDNNKVVVVTEKGEYLAGFFMNIKSMKTYLKRKREGEKFFVRPETIGEDENFVVLNFFILNTRTGRGLYQYYYGSSTINQFCELLSTVYTKLKNSTIDEEKKSIDGEIEAKKRKKLEKEIEKRFKGNLKYQIIERKDSFVARVEKLRAIKSFSFDYMHIDSNSDQFKPLANYAKRISHNVTFRPPSDGKFKAISDAISDAVSSGVSSNCKVKGIDPHGNEVLYKMFNDYDVFETLDYEETAKTIEVDFGNPVVSLEKSKAFDDLCKLTEKEPIKSILEVNLQ